MTPERWSFIGYPLSELVDGWSLVVGGLVKSFG